MEIEFEGWEYDHEVASYVAYGELDGETKCGGVELVVTPTVFGTIKIDVIHGSDLVYQTHEVMSLPEAMTFAVKAAVITLAA